MHSEFIKTFQENLKEKGVSLNRTETRLISRAFEESLLSELSEGKTVHIENVGRLSSILRTMKKDLKDESKGKVQRFVVCFKASEKLKALVNADIKMEDGATP